MRLTCNVYVLTTEGEALFLEAGSTPPEWALPQLGAHTLTDEPTRDVPVEADANEAPDPEPVVPTIPPIKGRGSSAAAWAAYAETHGFAVEPDAKASEIREALAEAGIPVE